MNARRPLMVVGCTSSAGKSLLVTALARWFARQGVDVAPFKAQNMSNNARVVDDGEIGVAQWLQALSAGVEPSVVMNPVLLKPEGNARSQVVVRGRPRHDLTAMPWQERGWQLWPSMASAYDELSAAHELVLIEGAGSPAEVNLRDLVNQCVMEYADARAVLVADIDRGGAFAHLFGTWSMVSDTVRDRLAAFVLNKFRGDETLLEPGPSIVAARTTMRYAGVLPMLDHDLPDEEGLSLRGVGVPASPTVGIVRYPYASNLDEFHLLRHAVGLRWVSTPPDLQGCDLVILPGSKHVGADLRWLRTQHLDEALVQRALDGRAMWGVCGGAMMLGGEVSDPFGVEGSATGLGLLPLRTDVRPDKVARRATLSFPELGEPFARLSGLRATGYEIRHGRIRAEACALAPNLWGEGAVLATTVHGVFEDLDVLEALSGRRLAPVLDATFDALADAVDAHLDTGLLWRLVDEPRPDGLEARRSRSR